MVPRLVLRDPRVDPRVRVQSDKRHRHRAADENPIARENSEALLSEVTWGWVGWGGGGDPL